MITGTNVCYANGGGGTYNATNISGGSNTGDGAQGQTGAGGSGIVVVSYPDTLAAAASTTGSPTVTTSGAGSLTFNGSSYLSYASSSALNFGSGSYTVEAWVYGSFSSAYNSIFDNRVGGATGVGVYAGISSTVTVAVGGTILISGAGIPVNSWSHIAVVKSGSTLTAYLNGTVAGSASDTTTYSTSSAANIGANSSGATIFTGYISNLRVVKGVAVYTGVFTPPTSPLQATQPAGTNISAITGTATSLLLNSVSGAELVDSSANAFAPTVVGSAPWNALSPVTLVGYKNRVYKFTSSGSITF
jgi:hypothetical protein